MEKKKVKMMSGDDYKRMQGRSPVKEDKAFKKKIMAGKMSKIDNKNHGYCDTCGSKHTHWMTN